jgi:hypothetical protein
MVRKLSIDLALAGTLLLAAIMGIAGMQTPDPRSRDAAPASGDILCWQNILTRSKNSSLWMDNTFGSCGSASRLLCGQQFSARKG